MTGAPIDLPPFKAVAAALRKTTEHLARELAAPSAAPPDWNEFEWAVARSVAAMQGTSMLLANNLRWRGPPAWQSFLAEQREQSLRRDVLIGELLTSIDSAARVARVPCVALKGAALRALGLYCAGERPMGDVDLLVRDCDRSSVAHALRSIGYREVADMRRHIVYEMPHKALPEGYGEHADNPLKVEVHFGVAELLPVRKVDITARLRPARAAPGLNAYPSLAALLLHLLLHAAGNMRAHALRQIQLHDIALLARRMQAEDWDALLAAPSREDAPWWIFPPLELTTRYYACGIPLETLRALRAYCPRTLRFTSERASLTYVSWSNLRIHAFPGIAWSRTPLDALRHIRSRVLPERAALAELQTTLRSQPQLGVVPWYGEPHRKRVVRWLLSRPPRVQTILSVTASLSSRRT